MEADVATELEKWARAERQFLREELDWLNAGGRVISPSGDEITEDMKSRKKLRIEHISRVLGDVDA